MLAEKTASWPTARLQARLKEEGIPCGPIQDLGQVFTDPQVLARQMIVELPHRTLGTVKTVANPIKFSATPLRYAKAPPVLGEDTIDVLKTVLGLNDEVIDDLERRGVV
jgi:crotonobetainyl-CoA:carnitine CoA-transferase CaiB-like acyl-CoA transferase